MKKVAFILFCIFTTSLFSQEIFGPATPKRALFGFNLGTNYSLLQKQNFEGAGTLHNGFGFRLGLLADIRANDYFHYVPKIELAFNESSVKFDQIDGPQPDYEVYPVCMDIMNHLTFTLPNKRSALYFYLGPNVRLPIKKKENTSTDFPMKTDLAIDFGIGLDNTLKFFNFAPEIRYTMGLMNVSAHPQISKLKYHSIALVFNFKG